MTTETDVNVLRHKDNLSETLRRCCQHIFHSNCSLSDVNIRCQLIIS